MDVRATAIERSVDNCTPEAPPSGHFEQSQRQQLSEVLWGIRWAELLPRQLPQDITVIASCYDHALPFIEANYSTIFEDKGAERFLHEQSIALRARYYRMAGDFFEFKQGKRTVGLIIGAPVDWSTYYIRSVAALPEVQGKRFLHPFMPMLFGVLQGAGVQRVETDTSPSNMAMLHLLSRLRFNPSGTLLTDRWGALVRFTRFLDDDPERIFIDQFCTGIHYQLRNRVDSAKCTVKGDDP